MSLFFVWVMNDMHYNISHVKKIPNVVFHMFVGFRNLEILPIVKINSIILVLQGHLNDVKVAKFFDNFSQLSRENIKRSKTYSIKSLFVLTRPSKFFEIFMHNLHLFNNLWKSVNHTFRRIDQLELRFGHSRNSIQKFSKLFSIINQ